ncbi:Serine/threonine protein kinase [Streptomyces sp. 3213]|uniref:serine/threonine-protein kinase n=1 Tax=Streptomyces sp. 3213.3 TaxID=1855348 RepID=UPI00089A8E50|nr:serine/threonine-protein kinase [Streptomyces sp. 3213.3]SEC54369.1 Serine/threonine protein kinase [Streptomyces sp. 3213] [Streptomyces sp. 3213.3]
MSDEGRRIAGRYRLAEQIGRGGMGTVWRADDEVLGRQVAIKRLHARPELSAEELATLYERTRREARSAARIQHPNVIVVHDVVDDDGRPCIVMEYVPGPTLADLLKDGRTLPHEEAARIGLDTVAALRAAHAAGVLHRDVKPGNVLLGTGDRTVLTDFGIAMTDGASTLTKTGEMVGSIHYMAPERIRGLTPGTASDLWALGATLYQAVEGRPPFRRATAMETAYAIAVDPLEPMKQAGPLEPLIEALLTKEPDERPTAQQTERALQTAWWGEATAELPPPAPELTTAEPTGDAGRGRRRGRKGIIVGALALAAAATAFALHGTSTSPPGHTTSRPTTTPSTSPVPEGYHLVRDRQLGVSFPVPDDWKAGKRSAESVTYTDQTGLAGLTIGVVDPAGPNPSTHFADIETNTKVNYPTYRRLRMQQTTFRQLPAAVWEFTFQGRVRVFRAVDLGFGKEGDREYDIYLSAPDAKWDTYRPVFDTARDGFVTSAS